MFELCDFSLLGLIRVWLWIIVFFLIDVDEIAGFEVIGFCFVEFSCGKPR